MTGTQLRNLRRWYAMDSAAKLAKRLGCHPSTIYRNERRPHVTTYVEDCIDTTETACAFLRGMTQGEIP
jgi:IS30 family transposase